MTQLTRAHLNAPGDELTSAQKAAILNAVNRHGSATQQARRAFPRSPRAQREFLRGFEHECRQDRTMPTGSHAENQGRAAAINTFGLDGCADDRQRIALRLASPMRADPGRIIAGQADAGHLPLFIAANEPVML